MDGAGQLAAAQVPSALQEKFRQQLALLAENPRHPSLQTRPIQGAPGIYEARLDREYRFTDERQADDTLLLRVVGRHDETLKKP